MVAPNAGPDGGARPRSRRSPQRLATQQWAGGHRAAPRTARGQRLRRRSTATGGEHPSGGTNRAAGTQLPSGLAPEAADAKRSEPHDRQQDATSLRTAKRRKPARWCKTTRSEHANEPGSSVAEARRVIVPREWTLRGHVDGGVNGAPSGQLTRPRGRIPRESADLPRPGRLVIASKRSQDQEDRTLSSQDGMGARQMSHEGGPGDG